MTAENPPSTPNRPDLTSVIMVSYQTGPVLFEAIAGVLSQTAPVELCLVDNGNPPDVVARMLAMASADPRITFISGQGNIGFGKGCNLGAQKRAGEYLLFLNPDSKLPPDAVEKMRSHAVTVKRPYMIGARLLDENGKDQRGCRRALLTPSTAFIEALHLGRWFPNARLNFNDQAVPQRLTPMPAISGAFMFLPREDFWNVGGFDEGFFLHVEDLDLCLRFRRAGGEIYFAPDVVVTHIGATSKVTRAFIEMHKARGFSRYFHKNFGDEYPSLFLLLLDISGWGRTMMKIGMAKIRAFAPFDKVL